MHGGDVYNNIIDLDFSVNINPNKPPMELMNALSQSIDNSYRYPQYDQMNTRKAVASLEKVTAEKIYCTNGASEAFIAIVRSIMPKQAIVIKPSFFGYYHALKSVGCKINEYELKADNDYILTDDFIEMIDNSVDIIFLANPNNPTGKAIDTALLEKILNRCDECKTSLVIDECFLRLSDKAKSLSEFVGRYKRLYVVNAFTKLFSLPGIRAGYVVSDGENIFELCKQLPEWNLSAQASALLECGSEILENTGFVADSMELIREERGYLYDELCKLEMGTDDKLCKLGVLGDGKSCRIGVLGDDELCKHEVLRDGELCRRRVLGNCELCKLKLAAYDSDTNFILIRSTTDLYKVLLERGILIRHCESFGEAFADFYRISVKDHKSNERLVNTLYEIWG